MTPGKSGQPEFPVIDGHNDLAWALRKLSGSDLTRTDPTQPLAGTHTDLPRLRAGGVVGQIWSVYVPATFAGGAAVTATLEQIDVVKRLVAAAPDQLQLCLSADDVRAATDAGRIACLLGMEGGHSIDGSLAVLRQMAALGVRSMTLTHSRNTPWADSATDEPEHGGLTDFGQEVVREMNRLGMLVDLSHVAATTMRVALDVTAAPVVFTHSGCLAVCDHPRNVPDDVLARLANNNGLIMLTFVPAFVSQECADWDSALRARMSAAGEDPNDFDAWLEAGARFAAVERRPVATIAQVADHIEHAREVAGVDHIGLGGDFDGVDTLPEGLFDVSCYPKVFAELESRGWDVPALHALGSANLIRVLDDAKVASRD